MNCLYPVTLSVVEMHLFNSRYRFKSRFSRASLLHFMCYYLFFTGHMEYARLIIISSPVGDFIPIMAISSVINLLMHCLFSAVLMLASQVFFKGQMEYAMRIIIPVGEQIFCSWLFHDRYGLVTNEFT